MAWAPGELERAQAFYAGRAGRIATRAELELSLAAPPEPFAELYSGYEALVMFSQGLRLAPEEEFADSEVVVNQDIF